MHAVIFAGGELHSSQAVEQAVATADLVIAADSGTSAALQLDCIPSLIVGDLDSLTLPIKRLEALGSEIIRAPIEKNETDSELAIQVALERGATAITLLGGLGGERFDHTMANIMLLAGFETIPIRIIDGPSTCWLLRGPGSTRIHGKPGDLLSLLPLTGKASGVRTISLYYPLYGETLLFGRPRGVSNVLTQDFAEVSLERGLLLVIHSQLPVTTPTIQQPPAAPN